MKASDRTDSVKNSGHRADHSRTMPLTAEQVAHAQLAKKRYLISFLVVVCANGAFSLASVYRLFPLVPVAKWVSYAAFLAFAVTTWRLCRAIGIGAVWALIATALSPVFGIFELVVLLRVYARRTGIKLTFLLGDQEPKPAAGANSASLRTAH